MIFESNCNLQIVLIFFNCYLLPSRARNTSSWSRFVTINRKTAELNYRYNVQEPTEMARELKTQSYLQGIKILRCISIYLKNKVYPVIT